MIYWLTKHYCPCHARHMLPGRCLRLYWPAPPVSPHVPRVSCHTLLIGQTQDTRQTWQAVSMFHGVWHSDNTRSSLSMRHCVPCSPWCQCAIPPMSDVSWWSSVAANTGHLSDQALLGAGCTGHYSLPWTVSNSVLSAHRRHRRGDTQRIRKRNMHS